jgi:hypothetical protein
VKIIEIITQAFNYHGIDDAEVKAKEAADAVCKDIQENHEVVYFVRQHAYLNRWQEADEETYNRVMRESGYSHAQKLYRHAAGKTTQVPKTVSVEIK